LAKEKLQKFILPAGLIILFAVHFLSTDFLEYAELPFPLVIFLKFILIGACFLLLCAVFYFKVIKKFLASKTKKNTCLVLFSVVALFLLLEAIFLFYPYSHRTGYTLAAKRWRDYYWRPVNKLKMRDRPIEGDDMAQYKKRIFFIGDSFTAGHGIKNVEDRYSNLIDSKLPDGYRVINLGRNGNDTGTELYRLFNLPIRPDILVFQYFANDIEGLAQSWGIPLYRGMHFDHRFRYYNLNPVGEFFIKNSYFLNWAYWQFEHYEDDTYLAKLKQAYENHLLVNEHKKAFAMLLDFCRDKSTDLIMVVFPFMAAPEESTFYTEIVKDFFTARGVAVIDVGEMVKDMPLKERVVNRHDPHASPKVHALVAERIHEIMVKRRFLE